MKRPLNLIGSSVGLAGTQIAMRDMDGIEKVVARLKPHWVEIEAHFQIENRRFVALVERPHDILGRLLKCHLILEHYLDCFLNKHYKIEDIEDVKLSFYNKAMLLPSKASSAAFVKLGIVKLNTLRNRCSHNLSEVIEFEDLGPINEVLGIARRGTTFKTPIDAIEAFTTVACTWLVIPPPICSNCSWMRSRRFGSIREGKPYWLCVGSVRCVTCERFPRPRHGRDPLIFYRTREVFEATPFLSSVWI